MKKALIRTSSNFPQIHNVQGTVYVAASCKRTHIGLKEVQEGQYFQTSAMQFIDTSFFSNTTLR